MKEIATHHYRLCAYRGNSRITTENRTYFNQQHKSF